MTLDEKLRQFMDETMEKVNSENIEALETYKENLKKVLEDFCRDEREKAELSLKCKEESLEKQKNAQVAQEQLAIRERAGKLSKELEEKIFTEVRAKLEQYMATADYEKYLIARVKAAKEFAGTDEVLIYLDPADVGKQNAVSAATNTAVQISAYSFGGGIRAVIHDRGILIDWSFDSRCKELEENYVFCA